MDNTGQVINKKFIDDTETKHNPEKKQTAQQNILIAKQNYPNLVDSYDFWNGNKVCLFQNTPSTEGVKVSSNAYDHFLGTAVTYLLCQEPQQALTVSSDEVL